MTRVRQQLRIHIEKECRRLADHLKTELREGTGFTLLLFDMGEEGNISYVSTAERGSMMATLRELIHNLSTDADPEGMVGKYARLKVRNAELRHYLASLPAEMQEAIGYKE